MVYLAIAIILNLMAFWKERSAILYMVSGGLTLTTALWFRTAFRTEMGLSVSLMLLVVWLLDTGLAFWVLLSSEAIEDD